jgi:hypothetical protein
VILFGLFRIVHKLLKCHRVLSYSWGPTPPQDSTEANLKPEENMIEIRIGLAETQKELLAEVEERADEFIKKVTGAVNKGSGILWITDTKGRRTGVASSKIAYVEVDESEPRPVGFGAR